MQKGWYHIVNERKTSVFSNGLLWFGAGISIAEILTGMLGSLTLAAYPIE
ncbi:hypothetical protein [Megasphaera sp.]